VRRSKIDGPVVLFSAGIHGDEINGVEIVRQLITKKINKPRGTNIICIPVITFLVSLIKVESFLMAET
jgi:predicted deacylase